MRNLSNEEQEIASHLKASIWETVSRTVQQKTKGLSEDGTTIKATPQFVAALVELVYRQLAEVGEDLALFANHARRKTVTPDDLYMIVRRNENLQRLLKEYGERKKDEAKKSPEVVAQSQSDDEFSDMGDYI